MASTSEWIAGARPRTLTAAFAPVVAGTGAATLLLEVSILRFVLALTCAVGLQVAVNYANDYSDGIRGTDDNRVGPMRLVGSGLATAAAVKQAAIIAVAVAATAGLALVALTQQWWLLAAGAVCIAAAWFYTGGKKPYGYLGFGELAVFIFFGPVATLGTQYTQAGQITAAGAWAGVACGLMSVSIMLTNNIRDIAGDREAGKRTLAVRLGDTITRRMFAGVVIVAALSCIMVAATALAPVALLALVGIARMAGSVRDVLTGGEGPVLVEVLMKAGATTGWVGLFLGSGMALAASVG